MLSRLVFAFLLLTMCVPVLAQDVPAANAAIGALSTAATEYRAIDTAFSDSSDAASRRALQDRANTVSRDAAANVAILTGQIALVDARTAQLGTPTPGVTEAPDIQAQRKQLAHARSTLDSAIKRGKLLGVEADQLATEIGDSAADAFNERITARTPSPLTPRFWSLFAQELPRDMHRLATFTTAEGRALAQSFRRGTVWGAVIAVVAALALLIPLRIALVRFGRRLMIERAPGSRLRRSGLALWIAVSDMMMPGFAAIALLAGVQGADMIAPAWAPLADAFVRVAFVCGALLGLADALLQPGFSSWRLPPISDEAAIALRRWARAAAGVVAFSALLSTFMAGVSASGPLSVAGEALCVLLDIALVAGVLRTIRVLRAKAEAAKTADETAPRLVGGASVGIVALLTWAAILFAIGALLSGYFTLALTVSRMMLWWPLVGSALYLLLVATDDLCTGLIAQDSRLGYNFVHGFGIRGSLINQAGVFLSAIVRLSLVALAFTLATGPFGSNVSSLLDIATLVAQGLTIGQITISPGAIIRAFAVLAAGLFVVRVIQHWLTDRYLPATELDAGAQNSIAMVARYIGLILAALWAMASLGIGIERIALLLSALSVGIGFGLQAITQNFVSGLILLAERPVKIGDWVRIGTDEGDIKRISVRATEIQIADKSTLIVPNSELITKAVLNKTLSDPLGRIQLQFTIQLGADVARARDILLGIYGDIPAVLEEPAPSVFIDSIGDGRVAYNSFAYVRSPRDVYGTRSAILFRLLADLPAAGIDLGTAPQQMQILSDGRIVQDALAASGDAGRTPVDQS